jgi:hypothetical protein
VIRHIRGHSSVCPLQMEKMFLTDGERVIYEQNKSFTDRKNAFYGQRKSHLQTKYVLYRRLSHSLLLQ